MIGKSTYISLSVKARQIMINTYFNSFKQINRKVVYTFNRVKYVNMHALHLLFLQIIGKVSMFDLDMNLNK